MRFQLRVLLFFTPLFLFCPASNRTQAPVAAPVENEAPAPAVPPADTGAAGAAGQRLVSFQRDVLPILKELAGDCHTKDDMAGNYAIDSYEAVMAGGTDSVPNVVPGKPEASLLFIYLQKGHPFGRKPPPEQLEVIRQWILQGAKNN